MSRSWSTIVVPSMSSESSSTFIPALWIGSAVGAGWALRLGRSLQGGVSYAVPSQCMPSLGPCGFRSLSRARRLHKILSLGPRCAPSRRRTRAAWSRKELDTSALFNLRSRYSPRSFSSRVCASVRRSFLADLTSSLERRPPPSRGPPRPKGKLQEASGVSEQDPPHEPRTLQPRNCHQAALARRTCPAGQEQARSRTPAEAGTSGRSPQPYFSQPGLGSYTRPHRCP